MKKQLLFSLMCAGVLSAAATPGNRVFYGYNLGSEEWAEGFKTYDCGFVSYPFDLSADGKVLKSYLSTPSKAVYAGAGIEGGIYAYEYEYSSSTSMPEPTDFVSYNTINGVYTRIAKWNEAKTNFKPSDMTYSIKDDKLYAVGYDEGSGLYEVDRNTGAFTLVCPLTEAGTIAADAKGNLYTMSSGGVLYIIDVERGRQNKIWTSPLQGMANNQTMEFDHTTGLLYWASCTKTHEFGAEDTFMQEIDLRDLDNITMREVGMIGVSSRLVALHIPYAENLEAPAAPTAVKTVAGEVGTSTVTLSWTNPTEAFGGGEIGTLYGLIISRDGERVAYLDKPVAGADMTWTDDKVTETGEHRYDIQLTNGKGLGAKGSAYQYVGNDWPAGVTDIQGTVADDFSSLTLTWTAPTTGAHLGSFDPSSVHYRVVRNDNVTIADNLTEPTVTDSSFRRLMNYSYSIYAVNAEGETAEVSPSFILGPALDMPLEQTFENEAQIRNRWSIVDANNDTFSWMFGTTLGQAVFGDYESCADYITSPMLGNEESADEWLITPPLNFEAGKKYAIVLKARSYSTENGYDLSPELVDVHFGIKNTIDAMGDPIGSVKVEAYENDPMTNTMKFEKHAVDLPVVDQDCIRCVGVHLVSPLMMSGFLQINEIVVGEADEVNAVEGIAADASAASFSISGRTLTIASDFAEAALYDLSGAKVASISGAVSDLSSLAGGVYVLNIDGKAAKVILK